MREPDLHDAATALAGESTVKFTNSTTMCRTISGSS